MNGAALTELPESTSPDTSPYRQALAERLHDGPLQDLVALKLKAAAIVRSGAIESPDAMARVTVLNGLAQAAIDHLEEIIRELLGAASRPIALATRLAELCDEFGAASGIECRLMVAPAHLEFEPAVAEIVLRSLRELLTNVRKYSRATVVKVTSRFRDDTVAITVADNGVGLESTRRRKHPFEGGGFGLWSIEHRLAELGGALELVNDSGLRATIVVPSQFLSPS